MRFSQQEIQAALAELNKNQKPLAGLLSALIGAVPAIILYFFYDHLGSYLYAMLVLPPVIVGFFARYAGRVYEVRPRISVGFVGAAVHLVGCLMLGLNWWIYLLAPVAFGVTMTVAKVSPERVYQLAIYQKNIGMLD